MGNRRLNEIKDNANYVNQDFVKYMAIGFAFGTGLRVAEWIVDGVFMYFGFALG